MSSIQLRIGGLAAIVALLVLLTASASTPQASAASMVLSMDSATMLVGASATLDLTAEDVPFPGLGAWTIGIVYDSSMLTALSCTSGVGPSACNESFSGNRVEITGASAEGHLFDVVLASITFACDSAGTTDLLMIVQDITDATEGSPGNLDFKLQAGRITCVAAQELQSDLLGDVNCDGLVNSLDALLVLQFEAGLISSLPCQHLGDVNGDGQINSIDAGFIKQIDAGLLTL